jgi:PAS domain S-box-containing protein
MTPQELSSEITELQQHIHKLNNELAQYKHEVEDLRRSKIYLDNILEHLPVFIYWKDKKGKILGDNKRHAELLGFNDPIEVIGKSDFDFSWREQASDLRKNDVDVMNAGEISIFQESGVLPDGQEITCITHKSSLKDTSENIIGIIGISLDITDRIKLEEKLEVALTQAKAANKAKTEFIANMSHDVRTPLSGIIGGADLLRYKLQDPTLKSFAEDVFFSAEKLLDFFNDVIKLSLAESDVIYENKPFNIKKMVDDLLGFFKISARMKSIQLTLDYDKTIPNSLTGNASCLYRVLQNLLGNAIKFTDKNGSVTLRLRLVRNSKSEDTMISVVVEDTGIGIPKNKQARIFEKLEKLSPSYNGAHEGFGMGLYIAKQFIEMMNGKITFDSEENKGSRFKIILTFHLESTVSAS